MEQSPKRPGDSFYPKFSPYLPDPDAHLCLHIKRERQVKVPLDRPCRRTEGYGPVNAPDTAGDGSRPVDQVPGVLHGPCNRRQDKPEKICRSLCGLFIFLLPVELLLVMIDGPLYHVQPVLPVRVGLPVKLLLCGENCKQAPREDRPADAQQQGTLDCLARSLHGFRQIKADRANAKSGCPVLPRYEIPCVVIPGEGPAASHALMSLSCSHVIYPVFYMRLLNTEY